VDSWDRLAEASRKPPAEARTALEAQLLQEPGFLPARFNLGTLLLESDPAKAAEQLALAAASTDSALAVDAWHNLALARFKQGRLEEALAAAEKAAGLDARAAPLRDELRRVILARQDEARRKAEEEAKKLHLDPAPLPPGRVGTPYAAKLPIAGGTPPATAALAGESKLPAGISLAPDGTFSGTPRAAGTTRLDLALQDSAGGKATGSVELRILPQPAITTEALPEAIVGQSYSARLAAVGFTPAVRWEFAALPAGLSGGADGVISGTPTKPGTVGVHVHASEGELSANRLIDLVVSDGFAPAEDPLPPATATAAYQHRVTVRGPAQAYRWSGGDASLRVAADGTVAGTPAQAGELKLPATISAADGRTRQVALTVPVNPLPLIDPAPVELSVGRPVDQAVKVTGGTPPYTWSVAEGLLPGGIRLDADGHLRGVAKDPGTSQVKLAVADRWKASTQADLAITVKPAEDPPPKKDEQKQDEQQQDEQQQDEQKQDGQDKQDGDKQDGQQPQPAKQDGQQQDGRQQEQGATPEQQQAQQAAAMNQTAADHWLDELPEERRDSLRYQLLDGGAKKPTQHGKAW
jgi:hypothetical protein